MKEINDDIYLDKHKKEQEALDKQHKEIENFMNYLCGKVDLSVLAISLDTPIQQDPKYVLNQIQLFDDEELPEKEEGAKENPKIISETFFSKIVRQYAEENKD